MGKTTIEWCDFTLNPWRGCTKIASGCAHCYADTMSKRNPGTLGIWGPDGTRVVASESMWAQPLKWDREAMDQQAWYATHRSVDAPRPRVFCASLADVFEDWQGECLDSAGCAHYTHDDDPRKMVRNRQMVGCDTDGYHYTTLNDVRRRLFALIDATPNLDWLLLTKRPENIRAMWPATQDSINSHHNFYRDNVWLGTSIATQADAERNIPHLLKCRDLSPVLFVSAEPLLGPVDLSQFLNCKCDVNGHCDLCLNGPSKRWVIVGGESGPHARPMHPDWVRALRDQCAAAGVPFLFKQHGEFLLESQWASCTVSLNAVFDNEHQFVKVGKKAAGRMLDGVIHDGYPTKLN